LESSGLHQPHLQPCRCVSLQQPWRRRCRRSLLLESAELTPLRIEYEVPSRPTVSDRWHQRYSVVCHSHPTLRRNFGCSVIPAGRFACNFSHAVPCHRWCAAVSVRHDLGFGYSNGWRSSKAQRPNHRYGLSRPWSCRIVRRSRAHRNPACRHAAIFGRRHYYRHNCRGDAQHIAARSKQ